MRVATLGSCLSRNTAKFLIGARIVNSVYHNRSDSLFETLSTGGQDLKPLEELCRILSANRTETGEFAPSSLLRNQSAEGFGRHRMPDGTPFHQSLLEARFDLILIDNFMDLGGRLYRVPNGEKFFCRYAKSEIPAGLKLDKLLTPEESAAKFVQIVELLHAVQPVAHIVFIHFPTHNYPAGKKQEWAGRFADELRLPPYADIIAPRPARPLHEGKEPQHFRAMEYRRYAAYVRALHIRHRFMRLLKREKRPDPPF